MFGAQLQSAAADRRALVGSLLGDRRCCRSRVRRGHRRETLEPCGGTLPPPGLVKRRREDVVLCSESYFLQGTRGLLQLCWMET